MNIKIDPETMAQITQEIEDEANKGLIERAIESAETIRKNLVSIKGEEYANLVEIGVLVHKRTQLMALVTSIASDADENFTERHRKTLCGIDATMSAHVLTLAAKNLSANADSDYAHELTGWIDRIIKAEEDGIDSIADQLFGDKDGN